MKIKHKIGFISLITIVDIFVIIMVVMGNDQTSIQNDVKTKTSAHVIESRTKNDDLLENNIETENVVEEKDNNIEEENNNEINEQKIIEETSKIEEIAPSDLQEQDNENFNTISENTNISYEEMSIEERENALIEGTLPLDYSGIYTNSDDRLTKSRGALYYNGHKETYYSEKVLPGTGLNIPGRHVAEDGTIRDEEGYICVAANQSYMPKGTVLITSLGPAKVYDTGCAYGTIDIYVNW